MQEGIWQHTVISPRDAVVAGEVDKVGVERSHENRIGSLSLHPVYQLADKEDHTASVVWWRDRSYAIEIQCSTTRMEGYARNKHIANGHRHGSLFRLMISSWAKRIIQGMTCTRGNCQKIQHWSCAVGRHRQIVSISQLTDAHRTDQCTSCSPPAMRILYAKTGPGTLDHTLSSAFAVHQLFLATCSAK